jgi:hypothetical protein
MIVKAGSENILPLADIHFIVPERNGRIAGVPGYRLVILAYKRGVK